VTTITCKIPERLDAELESVAEKRRVSKSVLVREAIQTAIIGQKGGAKLSAHDLMKKGCGIIKGGARDRSWNPKHLKGFGRD
jgi:metal-responsive CopG/Arc/MetJ family transcriptional regulator